MKHSPNSPPAPGRTDPSSLLPVRFEFDHPTATRVCIAGSFNHWHPDSKPMHSVGRGHWTKDTKLAPGAYEYCLVVDGQWMPDPLARDSVANPYGGRNSVLHVGTKPEAIHLVEAATIPMKCAPGTPSFDL